MLRHCQGRDESDVLYAEFPIECWSWISRHPLIVPAAGKNSQWASPLKSIGNLQLATRTFLIGPGVLRLRPTNRGMPFDTTAATAAMSPCPQRIHSVVLRPASTCINNHHVGIAPDADVAAVKSVNIRVVARRRGDSPFDGNLRQTGEMRDRIQHAQRHDPAASGSVRCNQKPFKLIGRPQQFGGPKAGAQVSRCTDLQSDFGFVNEPRKVPVRHGDRPAILRGMRHAVAWRSGDLPKCRKTRG